MYNLELDCLELHLNPEPLSRKYAQAIKAACGSYSKCLGNSNRRYVLVPYTERALIDKLVRTYCYATTRKITMIGRIKGHDPRPAWVIVHDVDPHASIPPLMQFEQKYKLACMQAEKRGIYPYHRVNQDA